MKLTFEIQPASETGEAHETGYTAHCVEEPGVITQGETVEEALVNLADAYREHTLAYAGVRKDGLVK